MMEMGIDRILFSVDYPFAENPPGAEWLKTLRSARKTQKNC
jgi:2,3-dihydroxybenzoate decarboxylase